MPAPTFPALAAHLCLRPARLRPVVRTAASTARPDHRIHARRLCPSSTRAGSEAHAADGESSPGHRTLLLSLPYRTRNSRRQNAFPAPLYQALPTRLRPAPPRHRSGPAPQRRSPRHRAPRSEEHTSELQSQFHLVCRLLLEKQKKKILSILIEEKKKKNKTKEN